MKSLILGRAVATTLATAAFIGLSATMAQASTDPVCTVVTVGWETEILVEGSPAVYETVTIPAVYEDVLVPAVYETVVLQEAVYALEFEFINKKGDKRWEPEGWNANDNASSGGWVATGVIRNGVLISAEVTAEVLLSAERWEQRLVSAETTTQVLVTPAIEEVSRLVPIEELHCEDAEDENDAIVPPVEVDPIVPPVEVDPIDPPIEVDPIVPPVEVDPIVPPVEVDPVDPPVDSLDPELPTIPNPATPGDNTDSVTTDNQVRTPAADTPVIIFASAASVEAGAVSSAPQAGDSSGQAAESSLANTGASVNLLLAAALGFGLLLVGSVAVRRAVK